MKTIINIVKSKVWISPFNSVNMDFEIYDMFDVDFFMMNLVKK